MTSETFFANFGHLADAPNGVKKLRELILQLAVQGKLVPQDPNEEPASVLLKKIDVDKAALIKEGKIKRGKALPGIEGDEPFALPFGWELCRLGNIASISTGFAFKSPDYVSKGIFVLRVTNISPDGSIDKIKSVYFPEEKVLSRIEQYYLNAGDILVVMVGGSLGKVGVVTSDLLPALLNQNMWRVNPVSPGLLPTYLRLVLQFINNYQLKVTSSTHGHLSMVEYKNQVAGLPPHEEQKRIVAKVDQLMALCNELEARQQKQQQGRVRLNNAVLDALLTARKPDEFIEHWQRISTNFDLLYDHPETIAKLRAAILQLAVQGKLVHQDPNDEPASVLLERIKAEKERLVKDGVVKKSKKTALITESDRRFELPKAWQWVRLGDALLKLTDGTHHSPTNTENGEYKYVTAKNIKNFGVQLSNISYVSKEVHEEIYARCNPEIGDLLYIKDGATTGIVTINDLDEPFSMLSSVALLKLPKGFYNGYLLHVLRSPFFYDLMREGMSGVAITRVTLTKMNNAMVPIAPEAEQKRIVAKVDQLMTLCDVLEAKLNQTQQLGGKLMEATVRQLLVA